ncbi:class I SAM-dependent methyltransferase [Stygiobacter electus]|jgi:SAM-dependent methyltransferase|uniref:Class I SAM-dependent methyltransferase n=1 Tax=Stygiobacter electus TaxID=3032292 RepID=A0AAE3TEQ2_9BACT|nr:class I SAM-dependent methyltransferase [Stygiobacter electus]MDF1612513.1 class I SAM-dependent methyltransferase [Stygiobacter electus]
MAEKHFFEQIEYTNKYLIPYFENHIKNFTKLKILEVGCAEAGLLDVFYKRGIEIQGLEISQERVDIAMKKNPNLKIVVGDITDESILQKLEKYDFIIMREVIEHIHKKESAFRNLKSLLNENGLLFISFPPKYSPFAGHQQIAKSFLKMIPYLHLLPVNLLKVFAHKLGEKTDYVDEIKLHYSTGMAISKFEKLCNQFSFEPVVKDLFLFRPIYAFRFGLPTIKIPNIPIIREVVTFGYETLLISK